MDNKAAVSKIIAYIDKIIGYTSGYSYEEFCNNTMLTEACVFNLSQIGETANRIDQEFADINSEIPWRVLYGLRNRIVHDYEGVNLVLIWDIISCDLSELREKLNKIVH